MNIRSNLAVVFLAVLLVCAGCGQKESIQETPSVDVSPVSTLSDGDKVFLTAVEYLLENEPWKDYWKESESRRFLSIDDNDPSDALLEQLASHSPQLESASLCRSDHEGVFEKTSGKPAYLYLLDRLDTSASGEADVHVFLKSVGWGGIMVTLTLTKMNGEWAVSSEGKIAKA